MSKTPDKIVHHTVDKCSCGFSLENVPAINTHKRQVIDIPVPTIEYTAHQSYEKQCPYCVKISVAPFPEGLDKLIQYGVNIKSLVVHLMQYHLIPYQRTQELVKDVFSV
jgi:transposase